ncbi:MAG: cytochrome c [Gammaproteobacteria bacterium]|nr:cytochrome c [Gammaproteobacteria bacterium]
MRRVVVALLAIAVVAVWWITAPSTLSVSDLPELSPDPVAGERIFWAGGCASCHATPVDGKRARGEDKLILGGGMELPSPYGVFRVPNISPHADGIGDWSMTDFVNAMQRGVSPGGRHYYPSFPYTSYAKAPASDFIHLKAYLDTLPAIAGRTDDHSLGFPWSIRRGIGAWKRLYLDPAPVTTSGAADPLIKHGRQLVEGLGHCGECHTARDSFGGLQTDQWLAGAPNLEGEGRIPDITPTGENIGSWSDKDIAYYLESGFTPEFDTVGGTMVAVQENMAHLTPEDRQAIAAYLKSL